MISLKDPSSRCYLGKDGRYVVIYHPWAMTYKWVLYNIRAKLVVDRSRDRVGLERTMAFAGLDISLKG